MSSSNNGSNNPQPQQRNLSRNRRYTQPPLGQERGAFAVRGVDGGSQSVSSDIHDDVTLLDPQDSTAYPPIPPRRGGGGPSTTIAAASSSTQHNPGEEEEPAAVIAHASVVDEQAEAERDRLLQERTARLAQVEREREVERQRQIQIERRQLELEEQQTELQAARLRERRRVLELEKELERMRTSAAGGATMPTAFVERVVPRQDEEEKQEVADPVPTAHQDQQDGPHETPQDLEGQPEGVRPISVRPVDDDTAIVCLDSTGVSTMLQMKGDHDGNDDEENDDSSNKRRVPRHLFMAGFFLVLIAAVAVIVTVVVTGASSGGSRSSNNSTDPATTTLAPTQFSVVTQQPSSLSLSSSAPSPLSSAITVLPTKHPAAATAAPTQRPTPLSTTAAPTNQPTKAPTKRTTAHPTPGPTVHPAPSPTVRPTVSPTARPPPPPIRLPTRHPTPTPDATAVATPFPVIQQVPPATVSWKQLGADLNGKAADDWFGYSIALSADGTIMAIGAAFNNANGNNSGHVRVFAYDTTASGGGWWKQLGADLNGTDALDWFGRSVALSADGTILAVGADGNDANGARSGEVRVFVYNKDNDRWRQRGTEVNGEAANDYFGESVALSSDGTILAVGARAAANRNDGNRSSSGHVRVFQYGKAEGRWIQLGSDLDGEAAGDQFGRSVALSGDGTILAAGGRYNDGNGLDSGHARVFQYDAARVQWFQLGADLDGEAAGDRSGNSVALSSSGFILAIGGHRNDANGDDSGHVRVFEYSTVSNKWKQLGGDLGGEGAGDWFGWSVALSSEGTVLVVGDLYNDDNGMDSGRARIFQYDKAGEKWNQLGGDLNGKAAGDLFGYSVALSADGTIVASGAVQNDDNGTDSGQVRVFQRNNESGDA